MRALVRNLPVPARALRRPPELPVTDAASPEAPALMVDVVVLTDDLAIFNAARHAVGERNPVWRARSAEESVDLLLTGRCGVLLIDMAAVTAQPASLVQQIVEQFPDVVVVVAGRREDESVLAGLIGDGLVYRFMHKPLSPKRAGMFLDAAIRSHVQRREGSASERALPLVGELRSRTDPRKWLFVGGGLIVFMAALGGALVARFGPPSAPAPTEAPSAVQAAGPLADPVLSRARAALAAGRYEAPPGRNALDLYSAVLLTRPDDTEARQGLERTLAQLVASAERAGATGDTAEARRLAQRVLQADARHAAALELIARLDHVPRPAPAATAATAIADTASQAGGPVASVTEPVDPRLARVPVSRLATEPVAAAPASTRAVARLTVRPDPLTPLIDGPGVLPTQAAPRTAARATRASGAAVVPGHPIAGYEQRPALPARGEAVAPVATTSSVLRRDLEALATPGADYPPAAFREGREGWVEVEFTVNELGATRDIAVVDADPRGVFDDAAVAAIAAWRYHPAVVNGQPVAQRTSVTLRFSIDD